MLGVFLIVETQQLQLKNVSDFAVFYNSYTSWVKQISFNAQKITGEAVKMDWFPKTKNTSLTSQSPPDSYSLNLLSD